MRTQQQQLLALLVAGVSALPAEEKRDLEECGSVAVDLLATLTNVPTPDASLVQQLASQTQLATATDPCKIPAVTGAPAAAYSSWMSDLSSWQLAHTDDLNSLIDACSDVPEIAESLSLLPGGVSVCTEITWESPTGSPTGDDEDEDEQNNDDSNDDSSNDDSSNDDSSNDDSNNDDSDDDSSNDDSNDDGDSSNNDNNDDSSNDSNDSDNSNNDSDDADSDNSNNEGGNGGSAATRETGTVAALAAVAMAGLISAVM